MGADSYYWFDVHVLATRSHGKDWVVVDSVDSSLVKIGLELFDMDDDDYEFLWDGLGWDVYRKE